MAYSDYGAFVWRNNERRPDKEDAPLFMSDEETFGADISDIPNWARIWLSLIHAKEQGKETTWLTAIHHGILGDGSVRVLCHKYGLPEIWEMTDEGLKQVEYHGDSVYNISFGYPDYGSWKPFSFDYKGYHFYFEANDPYDYDDPYLVTMTEPGGTEWVCQYGYQYGAGFEDEE